MEITLKIKTNRIYFEQWSTESGDVSDADEIRNAWESAIYDVVEAGGLTCATDIGVDHDPALKWYLKFDEHTVAWNPGRDDRDRITPLETGTFDLTTCDECDNDAADEVLNSVALPLMCYAARVADEAIEAAEKAMQEFIDAVTEAQAE